MKKTSTIYLLFACAFALSMRTSAAVFTIQVGQGGFSFSPQTVIAVTGDTIRWVLASGSHTTTCDGSSNTVLPLGATAWNSPINSGTPMFEYVLTVAGNYQYKCVPHAPGMVGFLNVSQGTGLSTVAPPTNYLNVNTSLSNPEIKFYIPSDGKVNLSIYDLTGKKVETIIDRELSRGEYTNVWDAGISTPHGTYLCRLESRDFISTRKFLIRK